MRATIDRLVGGDIMAAGDHKVYSGDPNSTAMHEIPVAEKNSPALHVLVSSCSCLMESIIKGILGNTYEFRCAKNNFIPTP